MHCIEQLQKKRQRKKDKYLSNEHLVKYFKILQVAQEIQNKYNTQTG